MIKIRFSFFVVALLFLLFFAWFGTPLGLGQQDVEEAATKDLQEKIEPEKVLAAPKDAKEKTGVWVFVVWMWISISVLVYFLRLKIHEVDRLHGLRFFSAKKN